MTVATAASRTASSVSYGTASPTDVPHTQLGFVIEMGISAFPQTELKIKKRQAIWGQCGPVVRSRAPFREPALPEFKSRLDHLPAPRGASALRASVEWHSHSPGSDGRRHSPRPGRCRHPAQEGEPRGPHTDAHKRQTQLHASEPGPSFPFDSHGGHEKREPRQPFLLSIAEHGWHLVLQEEALGLWKRPAPL